MELCKMAQEYRRNTALLELRKKQHAARGIPDGIFRGDAQRADRAAVRGAAAGDGRGDERQGGRGASWHHAVCGFAAQVARHEAASVAALV